MGLGLKPGGFWTKAVFGSVKYFLKNIYFSKMLFSGKENIFKCLVAL